MIFLFLVSDINISYFTQTLDHKNLSSSTFNERFASNFEFINNQTVERIILIFSPIKQMPLSLLKRGIYYEIANKTKSALFTLEMRGCGDSVFTFNLSGSSLDYITIDQILLDYNSFIEYLQSNYCSQKPCKILLGGELFGGTLATWFKQKFPHKADYLLSINSPLQMKAFNLYPDIIQSEALYYYRTECYSNLNHFLNSLINLLLSSNSSLISQFYQDFNIPEDTPIDHAIGIIGNSLTIIFGQIPIAAIDGNSNCDPSTSYCFIDSIHPDLVDKLCQNSKDISYDLFKSVFFDALKYESIKTPQLDPFYGDNPLATSPRREIRVKSLLQCREIGDNHISAANSLYHLFPAWMNSTMYNNVCKYLFNQNQFETDLSNSIYGSVNPGISNAIFIKSSGHIYESLMIDNLNNNTGCYVTESSLKAEEKAIEWLNYSCADECQHGFCSLEVCVCNQGYSGKWCTIKSDLKKEMSVLIAALSIIPALFFLAIGFLAWGFLIKTHANFQVTSNM